MSIVNISVNTETRDSTLTIDGELIPATSIHLSKGVDFDGLPFLRLSYIIEKNNDKGLSERIEFFLPDNTNASLESDKNGFLNRKMLSNDELSKDLSEYFSE